MKMSEHLERRRQEYRTPFVNTFAALSREQQMELFIHAIAEAYPDNAPRDRFGRIRGPRQLEKLRHLALALDTPGATDVEDQAGNVARALLRHLAQI